MPRDGLRSCRVVNTKFVVFDGVQCTGNEASSNMCGVRIGAGAGTSAISMRFFPLLAGMIAASMTQLWTVLASRFGPTTKSNA